MQPTLLQSVGRWEHDEKAEHRRGTLGHTLTHTSRVLCVWLQTRYACFYSNLSQKLPPFNDRLASDCKRVGREDFTKLLVHKAVMYFQQLNVYNVIIKFTHRFWRSLEIALCNQPVTSSGRVLVLPKHTKNDTADLNRKKTCFNSHGINRSVKYC